MGVFPWLWVVGVAFTSILAILCSFPLPDTSFPYSDGLLDSGVVVEGTEDRGGEFLEGLESIFTPTN